MRALRLRGGTYLYRFILNLKVLELRRETGGFLPEKQVITTFGQNLKEALQREQIQVTKMPAVPLSLCAYRKFTIANDPRRCFYSNFHQEQEIITYPFVPPLYAFKHQHFSINDNSNGGTVSTGPHATNE